MRIGYLLGTESWGGLEMNQLRNAMWMHQRGRFVKVYCLDNGKAKDFCISNNIPFRVIEKHKKYYDWKAARVLKNFFIEDKIEHIIIRDVRDMSVAAAAKSFSKDAFRLHYFMEMQLGVDKRNVLHTNRFRKFDTWSCPLHWLEEQVKVKTNMKRENIVQIPSPLDTGIFKNAPSKEEARKILGLPENETLIGLAGRFDPQKGQLMLLQAFSKLETENVSLVFIGQATMNEGNEYVQQIEQFIREHNLETKVHLLQFRNDTETFYSAIDAFVMGSKCETVGMVTLEAMATGTIVIGSNAGGTKEILQNGKLGYLFEPENAESLRSAITDFLDRGYFISKEEIQNRVAKFDKETVLDQVEKRLNKKK